MPNRSRHVGRVWRTRGLILLLLSVVAGCSRGLSVGRSPRFSSEPSATTVPALLVSEVLSDDAHRRIRCPIVLTNRTSHAEKIEFRGTGCSCYGATHDGRKLQTGEVLDLPAGESLEFHIEAEAPRVETAKDLQAYFGRISADGKTRYETRTCQVNVYDDVRFEPGFLNLRLPSGTTKPLDRQIYLHRCFRSETADSVGPEIKPLPEAVSVVRIEEHGRPELLDDGLWRRSWKIRLRITPSMRMDADAPAQTIRAWFPRWKNTPSSGGAFQLALRQDVPLRFPHNVHFGKLRVGQRRTQRLFVSGERLFELAAAEAKGSSEISSMVDAHAPASKHWVTVTLLPRSPGRFRQNLEFTTSLPELPEFSVTVTALVED